MHGSRRLHRPHVFFFPYWFISRMRQRGLQLTRPDQELEDGLAVELADSTPSICVTFIKPSALEPTSIHIIFGQGCSCSSDQWSTYFNRLWVDVIAEPTAF
ncbi:hypothetical protein DICSQDRAFT_132960 [Dichomitus squalens LYAD-421 SS1]|uniref:uncharacterized protein n=1 Tax=Dichomitus squalens (strain LYAD-421) TaxID=732165 RepID=UPI0004415FA1|nr:uncharacterized protein DICSQDRAFT_132960 [Dichomitus squalens LYAD-421 SS1]EJF65372.1 hypothetical protein DICSQDRAFT_132960 [Dichomitus squalens LYAD-421 SS1]